MKNYAKRRARYLLVQALYQWQLTGCDRSELETRFLADASPKKVDIEFFSQCLAGVLKYQDQLDLALLPVCDRPLAEINPVELAVLRMGVYELKYELAVPYKVVIKEALLAAKRFGSTEGYRYVNGILDVLARELRAAEIE